MSFRCRSSTVSRRGSYRRTSRGAPGMTPTPGRWRSIRRQPMDDPAHIIDSLRREVVNRSGEAPGRVRVVRAPYRVCPLGAHIDHQLGPVTAMAINRGVFLAYAPSPTREVLLSSLDFPG